MKKCTKCKIEKSLESFPKSSRKKDGYNCWCKECMNKTRQVPIEFRIIRKSKLEYNLKSRYNLTIDQVQEMYNYQEGKCGICKKFNLDVGIRGGLYIDHNHETGEVRGLLCSKCNFLLGMAEDNQDILYSAIKYLNVHK